MCDAAMAAAERLVALDERAYESVNAATVGELIAGIGVAGCSGDQQITVATALLPKSTKSYIGGVLTQLGSDGFAPQAALAIKPASKGALVKLLTQLLSDSLESRNTIYPMSRLQPLLQQRAVVGDSAVGALLLRMLFDPTSLTSQSAVAMWEHAEPRTRKDPFEGQYGAWPTATGYDTAGLVRTLKAYGASAYVLQRLNDSTSALWTVGGAALSRSLQYAVASGEYGTVAQVVRRLFATCRVALGRARNVEQQGFTSPVQAAAADVDYALGLLPVNWTHPALSDALVGVASAPQAAQCWNTYNLARIRGRER